MRFYWPIAKFDGEQRMVWGYASTEAEDDQGEMVTRTALAAALDDYMRFANIREMHRPSAVGVAQEAAVDDKGLYLGAKIVDAEAWEKVVAGVYKGFSIGGRVTARDPADRRLITGLDLTEISIVDRPANPDAVFDCWKLAGAAPSAEIEYADPGHQPDGKPRYPIAAATPDRRRPAGSRPEAGDPVERLRAIVAEFCDLMGTLGADGSDYAALALAAPGIAIEKRAPAADAVAKLAGELVPRLDALQQRVEQIAATPLPPQTAARGFLALAKRDDSPPPAVPDDIVAALAQMSDEDRTLTLIKAARAAPIVRRNP